MKKHIFLFWTVTIIILCVPIFLLYIHMLWLQNHLVGGRVTDAEINNVRSYDNGQSQADPLILFANSATIICQ